MEDVLEDVDIGRSLYNGNVIGVEGVEDSVVCWFEVGFNVYGNKRGS